MNFIYLYDGEFDSLVALIVELIKRKITPDNIKERKNYMPSLLEEALFLEINNKKGNIEQFKKVISKKVIGSIYYAFLSEAKDKEIIIYHFIKKVLIYKDEIYYHRKIECVNDIIKISKRVSWEAHKLKGFVRFKETENSCFYAAITPTNNVIGLLANHFKKRLSGEYWMIKDENRGLYALYDKRKVIYLKEENIKKLNLDLNKKEEWFEDLWKTFFKTIAIKERTNLKCQRNFMPKKYWNNMIEMEDQL